MSTGYGRSELNGSEGMPTRQSIRRLEAERSKQTERPVRQHTRPLLDPRDVEMPVETGRFGSVFPAEESSGRYGRPNR